MEGWGGNCGVEAFEREKGWVCGGTNENEKLMWKMKKKNSWAHQNGRLRSCNLKFNVSYHFPLSYLSLYLFLFLFLFLTFTFFLVSLLFFWKNCPVLLLHVAHI
ncbi:hypothetical protein ABFS82_10G099100 [Erythranthe guttata]